MIVAIFNLLGTMPFMSDKLKTYVNWLATRRYLFNIGVVYVINVGDSFISSYVLH